MPRRKKYSEKNIIEKITDFVEKQVQSLPQNHPRRSFYQSLHRPEEERGYTKVDLVKIYEDLQPIIERQNQEKCCDLFSKPSKEALLSGEIAHWFSQMCSPLIDSIKKQSRKLTDDSPRAHLYRTLSSQNIYRSDELLQLKEEISAHERDLEIRGETRPKALIEIKVLLERDFSQLFPDEAPSAPSPG